MTDEEFAKQFPAMTWLLPHREPSPPKPSWSELPRNIGPSAVNAVTGLYEMVRHPVRTLQALETVAGGAMNLMGADELNAYLADRGLAVRRNPGDVAKEEATAKAVGQALKDRYWGLENLKRTMITDPVGSALDILGIAGGGYGLVRQGLSLGSKARLAEIPGPALDAERLAANELGPAAAKNNFDWTTGSKSNTIRKALGGADPSDEIQTTQNAQDMPANAFNPPSKPRGSFEVNYAKGTNGNEIDEAGNPPVGTGGYPQTGQFPGSMPKQTFLTKGLEKQRHNYPPSQTVADDISTSLDSMPMKPRNKHPTVPLYDPSTTPQRPFEADYTKTPAHDETGKLLVDVDGDPIIAQHVAGRQTLGGKDVGFDAKTFWEVARKLANVEIVPRRDLGNSLGKMRAGPGSGDVETIRLAKELPERHMDIVLAHELGHALHTKAGLPPITDPAMRAELERNYSRLKTGIENPEKLKLPRDVHSNYHEPVQSDRELVADGYYAAFRFPDYAKKELPVSYATLRKWLKSNPELARLLINNSAAAATVAAALAAAGERDEAKAEASPPRTPQRNLPASPGSLPGKFIPFGLASEATRADADGFTELTKALSRRGLFPQTPKNEKFKDLVQALRARQKPQLYGGPR